MALKKKEINRETSGTAFTLPSLMTTMTAPQVELPLEGLLPAPIEWNFFSPLPDGKFLELCDSIAEHGLIHPLFIYENENAKKIILSGHNRVRALHALFETTGDKKYKSAPCVVRRDLSEQQARDLIIDANWVQRELSASEKAKCIARRYAEQGRLPRGSGERAYDRVAEHFGIKATQVYHYVKIASLPEDILALVDDGTLSLKAAAVLCKLPEEEVTKLKQELGDGFDTDGVLAALQPQEYETLVFRVPKVRAAEIRVKIEGLLKRLGQE